jgi:hypothetical protein
MPAYTSPDVRNLVIGKARVYFKKEGDPVRRHIGNVPEFAPEPAVETLDHFSSQEGIRKRDRNVVIEQTMSVAFSIEEWTPDNLAIALMGSLGTDTDGNVTIGIGAVAETRGQLELEMSNDVGPRYNVVFPSVALRPAGGIGFISEEWAAVDLEGEIDIVDGVFGTATLVGGALGTEASESETASA